MFRTSRTLVLLALVTGCAGTMGGDTAPSEDAPSRARRVTGSVDREDAALGAAADLSAATDARVVVLADDGTPSVVGEAAIEADGGFDVAVDALTRAFLVQVVDAGGEVVGGALVTADTRAEAADAGVIDAESSVEASVWAEVVAGVGYDVVTAAEVLARVDAEIAAAVVAWSDVHGDADAASSTLALGAMAGAEARADAMARLGADVDARAMARVRAALEEAGEASLGAGLDAALAGEGLDAATRSEVEARVEATFRAVVVGAAEAGQEALVDASTDASARAEAWAQASAWADLAASGGAHADLAAEIHTLVAGAADASGDHASALVDLRVWSETTLATRLVTDLVVADDELAVELGALLGLELGSGASTSGAVATSTFGAWLEARRAELGGGLAVAAEAAARDDVEGAVAATGEAWASLSAQVDAHADASVAAAVMLAAAGFADIE